MCRAPGRGGIRANGVAGGRVPSEHADDEICGVGPGHQRGRPQQGRHGRPPCRIRGRGIRGRRHLHPVGQRRLRVRRTAGAVGGCHRVDARGSTRVPLVVVVRSHQQLRAVVGEAPSGFGQQPGTYHSDVIFLKGPLTSRQAMRVVKQRDEVDQAWPGTGVVYFARLSERRTQSRMSSIVGTPEYQQMTIRSWATTTKLLGLLDGRACA